MWDSTPRDATPHASYLRAPPVQAVRQATEKPVHLGKLINDPGALTKVQLHPDLVLVETVRSEYRVEAEEALELITVLFVVVQFHTKRFAVAQRLDDLIVQVLLGARTLQEAAAGANLLLAVSGDLCPRSVGTMERHSSKLIEVGPCPDRIPPLPVTFTGPSRTSHLSGLFRLVRCRWTSSPL